MAFRSAFILIFLQLLKLTLTALTEENKQYILGLEQMAPPLPKGAYIDKSTCTTPQNAYLTSAITQLRNLRGAAQRLLDSDDAVDQALYNAFFRPEDKEIVGNVMASVLRILSNTWDYPVVLTCRDVLDECELMQNGIGYHTQSEHGNSSELALLCICPRALQLAGQIRPCNYQAFQRVFNGEDKGVSSGQFLLHEMMHIPYLAGPTIEVIEDVIYGAYGATVLRSKVDIYNALSNEIIQSSPTDNADNFAQLSVWAYIQMQQKTKCATSYPLWGLVDRLSKAQAASSSAPDRQELRKLLSDNSTLTDAQVEANLNPQVVNNTFTVDLGAPGKSATAPGENAMAPGESATCSQRPNGTTPSGDCYPPLDTSSHGTSATWGAQGFTFVPSDDTQGLTLSSFAMEICPDAIAALCNFVGKQTVETVTRHPSAWIWAVGTKPGCLVGSWLTVNDSAVTFPNTTVCTNIMNQMVEATNPGSAEPYLRVTVNLGSPAGDAAWPDLPNVNELTRADGEGGYVGFLGPVGTGSRINGDISSWWLQAYVALFLSHPL